MSRQCDNCGRFVTDQQIAHSDDLGHSVCDYCADTVESYPTDYVMPYLRSIWGFEENYD